MTTVRHMLNYHMLYIWITLCKTDFAICCCVSNRYERPVIETYFWDGFRYTSVVRFLKESHDIDMCVRTSRRQFCRYVGGTSVTLVAVTDGI